MMQKDAWTWCRRCHVHASFKLDIAARRKVQEYAKVRYSGDGG